MLQKLVLKVTSVQRIIDATDGSIKSMTMTINGMTYAFTNFNKKGVGVMTDTINQTKIYTREIGNVATKYKELNDVSKQMKKEGLLPVEADSKNATILQKRYNELSKEFDKMLTDLKSMGGQYAKAAEAFDYKRYDDAFGLSFENANRNIIQYQTEQEQVLKLQKELIKTQTQMSKTGNKTTERKTYIADLQKEIKLRIQNLDLMKQEAQESLKIAQDNLSNMQIKDENGEAVRKKGVSKSKYANAQREVENAQRVLAQYDNVKQQTLNGLKLVRQQYAATSSITKTFFKDLASGWKDAAARIVNYTVVYRTLWNFC